MYLPLSLIKSLNLKKCVSVDGFMSDRVRHIPECVCRVYPTISSAVEIERLVSAKICSNFLVQNPKINCLQLRAIIQPLLNLYLRRKSRANP